MPVAPYGTDEYREWNRARMRTYRRRIVVPWAGHPGEGITYADRETARATRRRREARIAERTHMLDAGLVG